MDLVVRHQPVVYFQEMHKQRNTIFNWLEEAIEKLIFPTSERENNRFGRKGRLSQCSLHKHR